jgi:putative hydrolase of HD superfamily
MERIDRQLAFLVAVDRLKQQAKTTTLTDGTRRENAAEAAWHAALWALVFEDRLAALSVETDRVIALCLLADLFEIDSCDDPLDAAHALFSLLPEDQGLDLMALWQEVFHGTTPEARAARQMRCAQAMFQDIATPGLTESDRDRLLSGLTVGSLATLSDDWHDLHDHATSLLSGKGAAASPDLDRQLRFLAEADQLKTVLRGTTLCDGSRHENSGEHSWHIALFALVLSDHALRPAERARVVRMLLVHDIVEIDAGDNPIHGSHDPAEQEAIEARAADRLYGLLPAADGVRLRAIWEEFEAAESDDAIFAKSLDRVQPVLSNLESGGGSWPEYKVTRAQLETRVGTKVQRGAPALWTALSGRIDAWFAEHAPDSLIDG